MLYCSAGEAYKEGLKAMASHILTENRSTLYSKKTNCANHIEYQMRLSAMIQFILGQTMITLDDLIESLSTLSEIDLGILFHTSLMFLTEKNFRLKESSLRRDIYIKTDNIRDYDKKLFEFEILTHELIGRIKSDSFTKNISLVMTA